LFLAKSLADDVGLEFPRKFLAYGAEILTDETFDDLVRHLPTGRREVPDEIPF
jgi:hypothetical protein